MPATGTVEDLLRGLAPQVLAVLVRRHGQFDACEDAVQEALLAAALQWPEEGVPAEPAGWLVTVAGRRLTDQWRSESARRRRETAVAVQQPYHELITPDPAEDLGRHVDDTLTLLFLCCHPEVSAPSQLALTLRAVGGLTTEQIARAFLVPETTMGQRISRAKQKIKEAGATFAMPQGSERAERLAVVLHVLYLVFNEGYTATSGPDLQRVELTAEAIRLTREVHRLLPADDPAAGEVAGLLALMLLTDSRRATRSTADGAMVPLTEQDRRRWDADLIEEGTELIERTMASAALGPYQLQAAIAAVHAEAPSTEATDWRQILVLYGILDRMAPNPMITLNRAIATAQVQGPRAGLELLDSIATDKRIAGHHRLDAVRAHLLELAGDLDAAREHYQRAAKHTVSRPEQRYLEGKAARLK
ncbi:RNA polymerase sigma factor [Actinophytocola sp.]|uniref:RNA polymerase sigma factor n=1 Tax=Actinophytocola sp. TaxID=1872138 RepID=UPI002ED88B89